MLHECLAAGHIKCVSVGPRGLGLGLEHKLRWGCRGCGCLRGMPNGGMLWKNCLGGLKGDVWISMQDYKSLCVAVTI